MKLLKFVNCDSPNVSADALHLSLEKKCLSVASQRPGGAGAKSWALLSAAPSVSGSYWLLGDDNTPIGPIDDVLLAVRDESTATTTTTNNNNNNSSGRSGPLRLPDGVAEPHVDGVDLRSKMGRQLQRSREEYGQTFKTAAKNAALLMDAERLQAGREGKVKAERKRVVDAIENGEEPARRTRVKTENGSKGGSGGAKKRG